MWPVSPCGGYKGTMIHLVPSLWVTTVTLGTQVAITIYRHKDSSEKGDAPPAMARSSRLPTHWTARTSPQQCHSCECNSRLH